MKRARIESPGTRKQVVFPSQLAVRLKPAALRSNKKATHPTSNKTHHLPSRKLTASSPLKIDGWNTIVSFWVKGLFSGGMLVLGEVFSMIFVG